MIDWIRIVANTIWILAGAILLATLSYASWSVSLQDEKPRSILAQPQYQYPFSLAGALFCLGLAGTSDKWPEIALWLVSAALVIAYGVMKFIHNRSQ